MKIERYLPKEPAWLSEQLILIGKTGSQAYGTATESSDTDMKGIVVPPISYYLGLDTFNEYNNTGGKAYKNNKDDVDVSIVHISKFVRDAMSGVPNNIELLFLRPEDYTATAIGQELIDHRHLFLSKQVYRKFGGYAFSQIKRLENGKGDVQLIEKYGYDVKDYMHCIRLLTSAIEILETGDFSTYRPNREQLLACRSGVHTFEEALEEIKKYDKMLKEVADKSKLPDKPPYDQINKLLINLNKKALRLNK